MATAARTGRSSSFSRTTSSFSNASSHSSHSSPLPQNPGIKHGPNGAAFVSSGIPDLDRILGGGFLLGTVVMVMEDVDAPHHLLLLRNFMSQGIVHRQPLLFASPSKEPRAFLGTLPAPLSSLSSSSSSPNDENTEGKGLRIAWQYKKYLEQPATDSDNKDIKKEFSNDFDLRKPLERHLLGAQQIDCVAIQDSPNLAVLHDHCSTFLAKLQRNDGSNAGRIAIQSLCAPLCGYTEMRWQHLADTLLSVRAIPDEDKDLAKLLTGYQEMVGFLHVHKVSQINSQVPVILDTMTFSLKLQRRRVLVLELLNQAPVDGSSGTSYATAGSCSKGSSVDF